MRSAYVLERVYEGGSSQAVLVSDQRDTLEQHVEEKSEQVRSGYAFVKNQTDVVLDRFYVTDTQTTYTITAYGYAIRDGKQRPVSSVVARYRITCVEFSHGERE